MQFHFYRSKVLRIIKNRDCPYVTKRYCLFKFKLHFCRLIIFFLLFSSTELLPGGPKTNRLFSLLTSRAFETNRLIRSKVRNTKNNHLPFSAASEPRPTRQCAYDLTPVDGDQEHTAMATAATAAASCTSI